SLTSPTATDLSTLSLHDALPIFGQIHRVVALILVLFVQSVPRNRVHVLVWLGKQASGPVDDGVHVGCQLVTVVVAAVCGHVRLNRLIVTFSEPFLAVFYHFLLFWYAFVFVFSTGHSCGACVRV